MKRITATALVLALAATGATAESHMSSEDAAANGDAMASDAKLIRSRDITGGDIYTTDAADDEGWDTAMTHDGVNADWNQIGEIEDLVLTQNGQIKGIVAEVGGFLDMGDKHVMIEVDDLNLVAVDDTTYAYVTRLDEEELESMKGVDEGFWN